MNEDSQMENAVDNVMQQQAAQQIQEANAPEENTNEQNYSMDWYWSDGVPGEGEMPEWFNPAKYKTVAEQAKAQPHLEKMLGQAGAPENYSWEVLEDNGLEIDASTGLGHEFEQICRKHKITQSFMDDLQKVYAEDIKSRLPQPKEEIIKEIGEETYERFSYKAANILNEDELNILDSAITNAEVAKVFDKLLSEQAPSRSFSIEDQKQKYGLDVDSEERVRQDMAKNYQRYQTDPIYRKQIEERLSRLNR